MSTLTSHPVSGSLVTVVLGAALLLLVLLILIAGWFLWRHRLLASAVAVVAGLLALALLARLWELMELLLAASVLAFALDGPVRRLERRLPRFAAILIVYLAAFAAATLAGVLLVPQYIAEARHLVEKTPQYAAQLTAHFERLATWYEDSPPAFHAAVESSIEWAKSYSQIALTAAGRTLLGTAGGLVKAIMVVVLSIYLLVDRDRLHAGFYRLLPEEVRAEARSILVEIGTALGGYLRAQFVVILFVAVAVTLTLWLFQIPHALVIGVTAGALEVVPYLGAFAGAVPGVAIGFTKSVWHGLAMIIAFTAINQFEGHVIVPLVVGHHLEMRPLWILVSLLAGHLLFGIVGMIVAVPVVSILRILVPRLYRLYRLLEQRERETGTSAG